SRTSLRRTRASAWGRRAGFSTRRTPRLRRPRESRATRSERRGWNVAWMLRILTTPAPGEFPESMRVLSGIQSSGKVHLGNYFGAIAQFLELQNSGPGNENECLIFIADLHALTTVRDAAKLRELTRDVALDYLALGLDP